MRNIVDRCRVWENHADTEARRFSKPDPERALPIYTVDEPDGGGCDCPTGGSGPVRNFAKTVAFDFVGAGVASQTDT